MRKFLFAAVLMLAFSGVMLADGSDPMPLCRPTQNKISFDGGPGPLCPPKQHCPWNAGQLKISVDELAPMYFADGGPIPLCEPCPVKNCVPRKCPLAAPAPKNETV